MAEKDKAGEHASSGASSLFAARQEYRTAVDEEKPLTGDGLPVTPLASPRTPSATALQRKNSLSPATGGDDKKKVASAVPGASLIGSELPPTTMRTKIVCTLGPASSSPEILKEMILAGMDVVRLNFSHGDHESQTRLFQLVREISGQFSEQVSIICDVQGPKIRTGRVSEAFTLEVGDKIQVTPDEVLGNKDLIQIKYPSIVKDLDVGDTIFINDGIVRLRVESKTDNQLSCITEAGGQVSDHKGCNIPKGNLSIDILTKKDKRDLTLIAKLDPEFVAASFVETAADIEKIRDYLKSQGNDRIKIIAKIERPAALDNIDEIIEATDAIMVARGDLGVEIPAWGVPIAQKMMVKKCNKQGRPCIVATQMMESMTNASRPTRAEASDVFNAVLDGADAVMLSGETSVGKYPVETVRMMDRIVGEAELHMPKRDPQDFTTGSSTVETIGNACFALARQFGTLGFTGKILTIAHVGLSTRMVSKFRPALPIISFTSNLRTARELNLVWGVQSIYEPNLVGPTVEERASQAVNKAVAMDILERNDHVIVISSSAIAKKGGLLMGLYSVDQLLEKSGASQ